MTVQTLFAKEALLPDGWQRDVLIEIEGDLITRVTPNTVANGAETASGAVIPGMPNLHSHAFQRAMAGLTERSGPSGDNFWAWREQMYRFLERITPEDFEVIATQLYIEMLKSGYTSVAEFHYLHHDEHGKPYANPAEMAERIIAAAVTAGIGLTMLPVFYAHATFGGTPPNPGQKRFIHDVDAFMSLFDGIVKHQASIRRIGIAHSVWLWAIRGG